MLGFREGEVRPTWEDKLEIREKSEELRSNHPIVRVPTVLCNARFIGLINKMNRMQFLFVSHTV